MPGLSGESGLSGLSGLMGGIEIPLTISGLQFWVKADSGTFQDSAKTTPASSDGDVIGAWVDQSGKGNDVTQATTPKKPTLRLNVLNGKPVARFDGTDDRLISSSFSLAQPFTAFVVVKVSSGALVGGIFFDTFTDTGLCAMWKASGSALFRMSGGITIQTAWNASWNIHNGFFDGASSDYFINGSSAISGDASTNGLSGISIGDIRGNPNPILGGLKLDGDIAEILIYNSILSTADRQTIEDYLNGRYAIF